MRLMNLFRVSVVALGFYNLGDDALRAVLSVLVVWLVVELAVAQSRHLRRRTRSGGHPQPALATAQGWEEPFDVDWG